MRGQLIARERSRRTLKQGGRAILLTSSSNSLGGDAAQFVRNGPFTGWHHSQRKKAQCLKPG